MNKLNKKAVLIIVAVCLVLFGGKKFAETEFFMHKVAYPFAHNAMKKALFRGSEARVYSAELDSIWKKDTRKIIFVPSTPSEESILRVNQLMKNNQDVYNDSTTFFLYPQNSDPAQAFVRQHAFPTLPVKGFIVDMMYLNDIGNQVLVANIRRAGGREKDPDKFWYFISLESPFNPLVE